MLRLAFLAAAAAVLTACGGRDPVAKGANDTEGLPEVNEPVPEPTGAPPANAVSNETSPPAAPAAAAEIPTALHGRWGLTPRDCTSTRGDAKGLLTVNDEELRFYESVARPGANAEADRDSISGRFAFTGEGQTWTKFQSLRVQGRDLVRTETNPTASFTYAKCT